MLTFYLLRHGQTENNLKSMTMGGRIDTPLTEAGLKNAETLAKKLKGEKFFQVYSSDLGRAFITALIISEKIKSKRPIPAKELREVDFGIYTNISKDSFKKKCTQYKTDINFIFPEGESYSLLQKRVVKFIKHLEKIYPNKKILIISHSGAIRAIKCHFNKWKLQDHLHMALTHEYIGKFIIDNGKLLSYEKINS